MRLVTIPLLAPLVLAVLSGCSSMNASECMATDWRTVGYEDGVNGNSGDRVGKYRKACSKHGITPDLGAYQRGRDEGLREFCKPMNGFRIGSNGRGYAGVCPAALEGPFLSAYESGRHLYSLRARVNDTAREIDDLYDESARLDNSIANAAARILDRDITTEQRAQLLVDSKQMAERKGEIRERIPRLESDLEAYRRELDDYRATLSYVD